MRSRSGKRSQQLSCVLYCEVDAASAAMTFSAKLQKDFNDILPRQRGEDDGRHYPAFLSGVDSRSA